MFKKKNFGNKHQNIEVVQKNIGQNQCNPEKLGSFRFCRTKEGNGNKKII